MIKINKYVQMLAPTAPVHILENDIYYKFSEWISQFMICLDIVYFTEN